MNGATTMSDGTSGLERRLQHEVPYSRYVNCSNHKLALVFVRIMKMSIYYVFYWSWCLAFSSIEIFIYERCCTVFSESQSEELKKHLNLLKAATIKWLSYMKFSRFVLIRFEFLFQCIGHSLSWKSWS